MTLDLETAWGFVESLTADDLRIETLWENPAILTRLQKSAAWAIMDEDRVRQRDFQRVARIAHIMAAITAQTGDDNLMRRFVYWRGLSLRHVEAYIRLAVVAWLAPGRRWLNQEVVNFVTGLDVPGAGYRYHTRQKAYEGMLGDERLPDWMVETFGYDAGAATLAGAFAQQLLDEARPYEHRVLHGAYVMKRVPMPALDEIVDYDALRLFFTPGGIFASVVRDNTYAPFWWSPVETTLWGFGVNHAWRWNVLMACIWRDACVVRHAMYSERSRSEYRPRRKRPAHNNPLVLPRIISHVEWALDDERERILTGRTRCGGITAN